MKLGAHESIAGGMYKAILRGEEDKCEVIQIFTRSNRSWSSAPLVEDTIHQWLETKNRSTLTPVASHASYLINLASVKEEVISKSMMACRDEILRCLSLNIPYLVLHPGSHLGLGELEGIERIGLRLSALIDELVPRSSGFRVALENTAGQGTNIGWRFEHLRDLLKVINRPGQVAICFDTCHAFAAGYELRSKRGYNDTMAQFDNIVGLDNLHLFHLNDSKKEKGSRKDRHELIGEGELGLSSFTHLVNDPRFTDHPGILETPPLANGEMSYSTGLNKLRTLINSD
jgi:deoxyribonuclease-4